MKVRELINALFDYNLGADIEIAVNNRSEPFTISYGTAEGVTKSTCDKVFFDVDKMNQDIEA